MRAVIFYDYVNLVLSHSERDDHANLYQSAEQTQERIVHKITPFKEILIISPPRG